MVMASTGAIQVDLIGSLLKSTASDEELLADAAKLINCKIPGPDEIVNWKPASQQQSLDPKHERVLKWLLLKISKQEPGPGLAIINPDTYFLLAILLLRMPIKVALRQLQHADIFRSIDDCLRYTRHELATLSNVCKNLLNDRIVDSNELSRETLDSDAEKMHAFTRLISICHVLHAIQQMPLSGEHINLLSQLTRNAVKLSFNRAASIFGSGIWCICEALDHKKWVKSVSIEEQLVAPLIAVWNLASERIMSSEDVLYTTKLFADRCLLPSLQLAVKRVDVGLDNFIIQHCLLPIKQYGLANPDKLAEVLSIMSTSISQSSLQSNDKDNIVDSTKANGAYHPIQSPGQVESDIIALVVKLLSQLDHIEQPTKKDTTAKWHKEVFISLAGCFDIDLTLTRKQNLSISKSTALANLLQAFQDVGASPGLSILSDVILFYTEQDFQPFSQQAWRIVKTCLGLQHEIVSNASNQAVQVIEHILDAITTADSHDKASAMDIEIQGDALEFLLKPLLDALVSGRKVSQFLPLWQNCISKALQRKAEAYMTRGNATSHQIFWEFGGVQQAIQTRLVEGMSFAERLEMFTKFAKTVLERSQTAADLVAFYPAIITLTTIVASLERTDSRLAHTHQTLPYSLIWKLYIFIRRQYIANKDCRWNSLLLELLDELRLLAIEDSIPSEVVVVNGELILMLGTQILELLDRNGNLEEYRCASTAWTSLLLLLRDHNVYRESLDRILQEILSKINISLVQLKTEVVLSGHHSALAKFPTMTDFIYGCVSASIHCPRFYNILQATETRKLVENLYAFAFLSARFEDNQSDIRASKVQDVNPWQKLWQQLIHSDIATEEKLVYRAIQQTQINSFVDEGSALLELPHDDLQTRLIFFEFVLQQLASSCLTSISKEDRGRLTNHLVKYINSGRLTIQTLSVSLDLLCRFLRRPSKQMTVAMDSEVIWTISESFRDKLSLEDIDNLRTLGENLIVHWMAESTGKESKIRMFVNSLRIRVEKNVKGTTCISSTVVMATAIAFLDRSMHYTDLITKELQSQFLESQIQLLETIHPCSALESAALSIELYAILDNISTLPLSLCQSYELHRKIVGNEQLTKGVTFGDYFKSLERHLNHKTYGLQSNNLGLVDALCRTKLRHVLAKMDGEHEDFSQYLGEELSFLPRDAINRRLHELQSTFKGLPVKEKCMILCEMSGRASKLSDDQLSYLQRLMASSLLMAERQESMRVALQHVFDAALQILTNSSQIKKVAHALGAICAILDQNPWAITQERIDQSLSTITLLTQPKVKEDSNPSSQDEPAAVIFDQLVRLLSIIFQNHRPKIGGRWHLVLDALKGILCCLFTPYPNLPTRDAIPQTQWIQGSNSRSLHARSVNAFSRLLSAICDPSYKALRSKATPTHGRQGLNDASKAARAVSGQHMQHFIAEFCSLQLRGKMLHRDAIKPGLYAVFDAMGQDVQKTLNESLDVQTRVMFKALYDDWKRFGKWEGS